MSIRSLAVYRKVLRANRLLPTVQRSLADRLVSYVYFLFPFFFFSIYAPIRFSIRSQEFRNHQSADAGFVVQFLNEWDVYADNIQQQFESKSSFGETLSRESLESMSDDQIQQLRNLYDSASALRDGK